jgi:hypothetical protein
MQCEECRQRSGRQARWPWQADLSDWVDASQRVLALEQSGLVPAAFDGHIALYHQAGFQCACMQTDSDDLARPQADGSVSNQQGVVC